ncbi:MAG: hypothetical protein GY729_17360 [Desulfobacteraceae bacterium]|nr:hypothetical protein [Desulfobacteraceae bacterium]
MAHQFTSWVGGGISIIFGLYLLWCGFEYGNRQKLMKETPLSKIDSIKEGLVAIYGKISLIGSPGTLKSPLTKSPCVYYNYEIEKKELKEIVTQDYTDKTWKWKLADKDEEHIVFLIEDDTGKVMVNIKNAEIDNDYHDLVGMIRNEQIQASLANQVPIRIKDKPLDDKFLRLFRSHAKAKIKEWSFFEFYIPEQANLFILGVATKNENMTKEDNLEESNYSIEEVTYVSSKCTRKQVISSFMFWTIVNYLFGGPFFIAGLLLILFSFDLL